MSIPFGCKCPERDKPVEQRNWRVLKRNCHYSAFAGYKRTYSAYSTVVCLSCRAIGRTKAEYVGRLKDSEAEAA